MNVTYYQNQINRLELDIADLQKKIADETKKENTRLRQIDSINRSINKSTSVHLLQSKQREIQVYQNYIYSCKKRTAEFQKKIADKSVEIGRRRQDLRKAEDDEQKKSQRQQSEFQIKIKNDIKTQKEQLDFLIARTFTNSNEDKTENTDEKEYDFFISHASEDKNEFVRELAEALRENNFKVWYDEFELKIGDSLRKKIDNGLSKSKFGIVIISPSFFKKNWPEYELNGMVAREMNGHKVILPIWHKITKNEVLQFSPTLADKLAMNTSIHTIEEIVNSLKEIAT